MRRPLSVEEFVSNRGNGFTLLEMIVAIAITLVLIGATIPLLGTLREEKALDAAEETIAAAVKSAQTIAITHRWQVLLRIETKDHDGLGITTLEAFKLEPDPLEDDPEPIERYEFPRNVRLVDADLPLEIVDNEMIVREGSHLHGQWYQPEEGKRQAYLAIGRDGTLFSLSGTMIRTNMAFAWAEEGGAEDELLTLSVNPASGEVCRVIIQERSLEEPPPITSLGVDDKTGGHWAGTYGRQGMVIANYYSGAVHGDMGESSGTPFNYAKMYDYANLPDYVSNYEYLQGGGYEAVPSYGAPWGDEVALDGVPDPRGADAGLRRPDGSRVSSSVLAHHPKKVGIVFWMRDKRPRVLSVYGVENTPSSRLLTVTVEQIDDRGKKTGEPAELQSTGNQYKKGVWLRFLISGNVLVSCKCKGDTFVSGFFFDEFDEPEE